MSKNINKSTQKYTRTFTDRPWWAIVNNKLNKIWAKIKCKMKGVVGAKPSRGTSYSNFTFIVFFPQKKP